MTTTGTYDEAAIIEDIKAGKLIYPEIRAKHGITRHRLRTIVSNNGLQRYTPRGEPKKTRRCHYCGVPTLAKAQVCAPCATSLRAQPTEAHALPEGDWVVVHGVRRFVPADQKWTPEESYCGTEKGYQRHRYMAKKGKEPWPLPADATCGCREAHAAHQNRVQVIAG